MTKLVLAIDDDKYVHHVIEESLAGFCKLIHAKSGEEGLRQAFKYNPDIILLDIEMPGKTGYEVCRELKANEQTKDTPVMFLSGKSELAERVKGYNLGASDYIVKPFNAEELMARIRVLYQYRQHSIKLKNDVERAQITAEIAMTDSGDMGRIMRYVGQSYHAHDVHSLSAYFFEFFRPLQLDVVVAFWYQEIGVFCSDEGGVCPLEQELLEKHRHANRFVDFSSRTIINYPKVSILIKNMPLDDVALYGRYKDLFPHILEVTNAKIQDMEVNEKALAQAHSVGNAFAELSTKMYDNSDARELAVTKFAAQLAEVRKTIEQKPELKYNQELVFHIEQLEQTQTEFSALNNDLSFIKYQLNHIIESRNELVASLSRIANSEYTEEITSQTDIELF
ncbi:response regulator [Pseudoalteromonas shioyasakiensis]|uniref:response regulator transcription factor n=1 Tax=Pseudoalteromonas shioyasakiensis TaxID=1190813 RepID=UPI002118731F|nr:response regulator [Pseudoalteromonas shioyasakiensis]MCQ8879137.1 response regulator [Pseudoalteromonas shioyasakiensis]